MKLKLSCFLVLLFFSLGSVVAISPEDLQKTSNSYDWSESWQNACQNEFGSSAEVADWTQAEQLWADVSNQTFQSDFLQANDLGTAFLTRNGNKYECTDCVGDNSNDNRGYFLTAHYYDVPSHYLVHDYIDHKGADKNLVSLGSWNSVNPVMCNVPNSPPNTPSSLDPTSSGIDTTPQLSAYYADPNGNSGTLHFETGSGTSIGSCSVNDGSSCSVGYSSADSWGTSYNYQVYAEDTVGATSGLATQSFTTNHKPSISNLMSGETQVNPTLNAQIDDADGDCITVNFQNAENGNNIGSDSICGSGQASFDTSSVSFGSNPGTSYSYQLIADDGQAVTTSYTESFTTNNIPNVESISKADSSNDHVFDSVSAVVSDPDGESDISSAVLTVSDGQGSSQTYPGTIDRSYGNGNQARFNFGSVSYQDGGWGGNEMVDLQVSAFDGSAIGEAGRVSGLGGSEWHSGSFDRAFSEVPYVFATTQTTYGGQDPSEAHVRNVGLNGFETQHCEFENTDSCNGHNSEVNGWFAVSPTLVSGKSGWDAGLVNVDSGSGDYGISYSLDSEPLLFATPQTNNGEPAMVTRFHSATSSGATLSFCEQNSADGCDSSHASESVAWLALDPSQVSRREGFDYGSFSTTDSGWESISFSQNFNSKPVVIADVQTKDGADRAVYAEVDNVDQNGASIRFCESDAANSCDTHTSEEVAWMAVSPKGLSAVNSNLKRFPNHAPSISSGFAYSDDPQNQAFALSIDAEDVDNGADEITQCSISHSDQSGNSYSNTAILSEGETATCSFTIDTSFTGYNAGDKISLQATFTDRHGKSTTSSTVAHRIPNSPPSATNLQPSSGETQYGPTLNATYTDPNGDTGNLTFYNTSSGDVIGKATGLASGESGTVEWSNADTPGMEYSFTVEASDGVDTSSSVVGTYERNNIDTATVNGKSVTYQRDKYGTWIAVLNYEHFGGENPSVAPGSTFPQLPNGLTAEENVNAFGTSGETRHVDQISQYGEWNVSAVRLDGYTENHDREIHFLTTNQNVIDAVVDTQQSTETSYTDYQGSTTTLYNDHTANLPAAAGAGNADTSADHIFGAGFPFYNGGTNHWALAGQGNRWEVDDYPGDESKTTVHRVWVRVPNSTITEYTENFTTVYEPKAPYDPYPENESTVDTTTASGDEIAASVKVVHPDGRRMNVEFINASDGKVMDIAYDVESGTRAKIPNSGNTLRDESNTTYKWYARAYDPATGEYEESDVFQFNTVEVGTVSFDIRKGSNDNMDVTGEADNGWSKLEFKVTAEELDPIPTVSVNKTSTGEAVKTWSNVENNSVLSIDLTQDSNWALNTDSEYGYFIEAREGPNLAARSVNHTIYTYNATLNWDQSEDYYNVYKYDIYRAENSTGLVFDYGSGDYELVGSTSASSFQDAGPELEPGTFCWKIAASNPSGSSKAIPSGNGNCKKLE